MDEVVIQLAEGIGMASAIGWFAPILTGLTNVIPMLMALFYYADKSTEFNQIAQERRYGLGGKDEEYDFIVVGAGSAGSVVANRLSAKFNVLLLERGGRPNPLTNVPGMQTFMLGNPQVDYMYETVPQNDTCLAHNNRQCRFNAGHGFGGGSMLNAMIYIRGHPRDYDRWAELTNNEKWSYKNLLPFFLRKQNYCGDCEPVNGVRPTINPLYHNENGELGVRPMSVTPLVPQFIDGLKSTGVAKKGDLQAPYSESTADVISYTMKDGRRHSTFSAFVDPILGKRPTLTVRKYARVIEVLFKPGTNQVSGVKFERFGKIETVRASKEVILSAGSVASPKILLSSGIGPQEELGELGIPCRSNLPVGRNLQDHIANYIGPFLVDKPLSIIPERDLNLENLKEYLKNNTGPFATTFLRATVMLLTSAARNSDDRNWPDVQIMMSSNGVSQNQDVDMARIYNLRRDLLSEFFTPVKGRDGFFFMVNAARPRSRGVIKLRSTDYRDEPLIDPRYYSDPYDVQVTVEAIKTMVNVVENAPAYQKVGARLSPTPFPTCKHLKFKSDKYWECVIRHLTLTVHHFSGTNAMGSEADPNAVLDSELRVKGVQGLRVMDASVMPFIVTTNSNAPTMVIAERGTSFILEEYGRGQGIYSGLY